MVVCDHSIGDQGELARPARRVARGREAGSRDSFSVLWVSDYLGVNLNTGIAVKLHKICSPTYLLSKQLVARFCTWYNARSYREGGETSRLPVLGAYCGGGEEGLLETVGDPTLTLGSEGALVKGGVLLLSA